MKSPFAEFLNIESDQIQSGRSELRMSLQPVMGNSFGTVHGGVIAAMADSTAAAALFSLLSDSEFGATSELNISFCRPASMNGQLLGTGEVVSRSKKSAWVHWQLSQNQQLVANGSASFRILPRRSEVSK